MPNKRTKKEPEGLQEAVEKRLADMLGFADPKDVVSFDKQRGFVFVGKDRVPADRLANLKQEAEFVLNSELWRLLEGTIRHMAYEIMFTKSKTFDDMLSGKMLLYHLDTQKKLMEAFRSYQRPQQAPMAPPGAHNTRIA